MEFKKQHALLKNDIDKYLEDVFKESSAPKEIIEAMKYSLFAGGKRLRPAIALYLAREFGIADETSLPVCAALEMIHTYSLIHDDLPAMDDDDLRRGKPTNHIAFGEDMAILAGDGLLNLAFEVMLNGYSDKYGARYIKAIKHVAKCAGAEGMIGGQVMDIKKSPESIDDLKKMHGLKTGRLFSASVMPVVYLVGADHEKESLYSEFIDKFGLLFQITDDILDVIGNPDILGKSIGKDQNENKVTYVSEFGLEGAKQKADEILKDCLEILNKTGRKHLYLEELTKYIVQRKK
jgi:geranylgeranyl diphosphate synthase type II